MKYIKLLYTYLGGLPLSTYAAMGGGWGQASYTFPFRITCKKGVGGSRYHVKLRTYYMEGHYLDRLLNDIILSFKDIM